MGGGGVQRIQKFIKYWDYNRFHLSVLTVKPSYFYARDTSLRTEVPDQVSVHRTGTLDPFRIIYLIKTCFPTSRKSSPKGSYESGHFFRWLVNLFFLPDSRILWLPFAIRRIGKIHRSHAIDLIIASMPPFTTGRIAFRAWRRWSIPYMLDFRDAWTHNPYLPRLSAIHGKIQNDLEQQTINSSSGNIFVNPALGSYYQRKYPFLQGKRIRIIRNGYDREDFSHLQLQETSTSESLFKIGIMGTIYSRGNAPYTLLRAVSILKRNDHQLSQKLRIVFMGKWTRSFYSWVQGLDIRSQVEFIPYQPHQKALELARDMNALALALHSQVPGSDLVTPGRIYEYLYLKKPILAMCALPSDLADLIQNNNAGEVVDYQDTGKIVEILSAWLMNGVTAYSYDHIESYDRRVQTVELLEFIAQEFPE